MEIVLVIGSGGREYELARQMALSKKVKKVYIAPGNAGTAKLPKSENVPIGPVAIDELTAFVKDAAISAVIIGPDASVAAGVGDAIRELRVPVFGPNQAPGRLESSKAYAADFMSRHSIPQPEHWTASTLQEALEIIKDKNPTSYVLKADGLAAGKGVVLPDTGSEAQEVLAAMFSSDAFDGAGKTGVVIQERLHGPEVSAFAVSDGTNIFMLPFAQDHKRLNDHDQGPNTGGMGAYCPVPASIISYRQAVKIQAIAQKTIAGIKTEGTPYKGVLYIGLMLAKERGGDPVVIEYNARFGDPEAQVLLTSMQKSGVDVADLLLSAAREDISHFAVPPSITTAVTVAVATSGYPDNPRKGDEIFGLDKQYPDVIVQQAGTAMDGDKIVTSGGRVLYVTGTGDSVLAASKAAYGALGRQGIHFKDMHYRTDIAWQALER
jgi:phosphoribosylamine--glycine ligase